MVKHTQILKGLTSIRFVLEITFLVDKYFFRKMAYELLSQSRKRNRGQDPIKSRGTRGGWEDWNIKKKAGKEGRLLATQV